MELTPIEKKLLSAWQEKMPFVSAEKHLNMIKDRFKKTAYHEAGHAAAACFFGEDHSHFHKITAIPTIENSGVFVQRTIRDFITPEMLSGPEGQIIKRLEIRKARIRIISFLAGPVAEAKFEGKDWDSDSAFQESFENFELLIEDRLDENWKNSCDEGKALAVAETIASQGWPAMRIIRMLEGWTKQMIDLPPVWEATQALARRLIEKGEITDFDEYDEVMSPILCIWGKYPRWGRRFSYSG